jgi:fumarylacetoacetase
MDRQLEAEWSRRSWLESANNPACGFPIQSLPFCIFSSEGGPPRSGVGIGDQILDLRKCRRSGLLEGLEPSLAAACEASPLNALIACGPAAHAALRGRLIDLLDASADQPTRQAVTAALTPMAAATLLKPVDPPNYTDFYASIHHATRVGRIFRPENPLLPNYAYVPIGYHGRASSIVVSGTSIRRPTGQTKPSAPGARPGFGPTKFLDYELEVGMYIAEGNPLGEPVSIREAGSRIFGFSLLNDWSARDIQAWESQPLGPFLGKSFATSVSPWVVPLAALAPFRFPARIRPSFDNSDSPLTYLFDGVDQYTGAIDATLEVFLLTPALKAANQPAHRLSTVNLRELWWTPAQLIAHHTSNGCNLMPGDLLATGTVSGREDSSAGCLLELTAGGKLPIELPNGEVRTALEDGDEVILRGFCRREGFPDVSLGECRGMIAPAAAPRTN